MNKTTKIKKLKGVSLFASAGIAETFLHKAGVEILVANELLEDRADLYRKLYPETIMVTGDITNESVFNQIVNLTGKKVDFLLASPPCQGISIAGKNRNLKNMLEDERNYLVWKIIDFIKIKKPKYILIENVPNFLKLELPYEGKLLNLLDIFSLLFGREYIIDPKVVDSQNYGVPQRRLRSVIKIYKKGLVWEWPKHVKKKTVREAIGHLPSLESGQKSDVKWHYARNHSSKHVEWMKHTPTGRSAFDNKTHIPISSKGQKIKGYNTTYRRMKWEEPAPTITMRNDAISSQLNVHPGVRKKNGTYSDARVLTPKELMILSSLPPNWAIPMETPEMLIRKCLGECIPPLMIKKIVAGIK